MDVVSIEEAKRRFADALPATQSQTEEVPLADALGRVLARDVASPGDVPAFDRSDLDGFAIRAADTFGADGLVGITAGFEAAKLKPAFVSKYDRSKPDFTQLTADVKRTSPQAVFVVGSGTAVTDALKAMRVIGSRAQLVTLSNNASAGFIKGLGEYARGTIVTQVFPNERSISSPLVKEALTMAKAKNIAEISPAMLEGFAAAKVLVEGLRRAGANASGEKLRNALETIRGFDIGGLDISYSATDHTGLEFVDLSIINKDGKFTR